MSSMLKDPFLIQRSIFTFFAAKMPRDDILANLLRAHEHKPNFFPRVDYRDVDFWLKSFEEGNFDLEQVPTAALRGTCRIFKDFLDGAERLLKKVFIGFWSDTIFLEISSGKPLDAVYRMNETGCEITKNGKTIQSKKDFITSALEDFKQAIQQVHTKIKLMVIENETSVDKEQHNKFYSSVVGILSGLKFKIYVEKLQLSVFTPNQVLSILSEIDQSNFTSLDINCNDRGKGFVMDDIVRQFFWPNLKCFTLLGGSVNLKLDSVQHIPDLIVTFSSNFTYQEMKRYRDYILKLPNFKSHMLRFVSSDYYDLTRWKKALKPFTPILNEFGEELPRRGGFSLPDGKFIHFDFVGDDIMFNMK
ncbi:hypothetical protein CAEBREN_12480 [Caenorhabditis brenneri]|uniref:DUF38 domain-containing protein n=1 Tax=Caenorhabditis brenneri TaxID=135651 RepID=G0MT00_CAEBE|nr:hypothetical protein CAEBREN_12480 [Caenorhabditis brenneri]